jgi:hypothetical protein|tara:strand:+ start:245 stop:652 length:408 start_codon:yes stop_codon:yes gene_type:complete
MRIIGFNLTKLSIERNEKPEGKLEIKQDINIDEIKKEKIDITSDEALKIDFTFSINYEPKFANVEFKGQVITLPNKEEMKTILKQWKTKQLPEGIKTGVFNFIMAKCNVKALALEDEMGLPTHVPMPRINPKKEE